MMVVYKIDLTTECGILKYHIIESDMTNIFQNDEKHIKPSASEAL